MANGDGDGNPSGIGRSLRLLREVGVAGAEGARVSVLARRTGLPKSTVHRLLAELRRNGWVEQDAEGPTYFLGFQARVIGDLARRRHRLPEIAEPIMARLAERSGQTAILSIREGFDALCVARSEGRAPIRAVTSDVGACRPLGWGAGSTALLLDLDDEQLEEVIEYNRPRYPDVPAFDPRRVKAAVVEARRKGFAAHDSHISRGVGGLAVCVRGGGGQIECSVSLAFVADLQDDAGRADLLRILREEVGRLERRLTG